MKTKLNLFTLASPKRDKGLEQNNTSFRELPFGVLKLLHSLLLTYYTDKVYIFVKHSELSLCWDVKI